MFDKLLDVLPQFVSYTDRDLIYRRINRQYERAFGIRAQEVVGKPLEQVIGPKALAKAMPHIRKVLAGQQVRYQEVLEYADGKNRHIEGTLVPDFASDGTIAGYYAILTDVTEHVESRSELHAIHQQLKASVQAGQVGLWRWVPTTNEVVFSDIWKKQIGYQPHEIADDFQQWQSRVHPDDLDQTLHTIREALESDTTIYKTHFRFRHRDGHYRWIEASATIQRDPHGRAVEINGAHVDITRHKESEAIVRESEQNYRTLARNFPNGLLLLLTRHGHIVTADGEALASLGFDAHRMLGQSIENAMPELWQQLQASFEEVLSGHEKHTDVSYKNRVFHTHLIPLLAESQVKHVFVMVQDITEQKEHEKQRELLIRELNHRVKNNLAMVIAMANQTLTHTDDLHDFKEAFTGRIYAMAKAHEVLVAQNWSRIGLHALTQQLLEAYVDQMPDRITWQGSDIPLTPEVSMPLSLVINELLTNAVKYGGLSDDQGRVSMDWHMQDDHMVCINWCEQGGMSNRKPRAEGVGMQLIRGLIEYQLGGRVSFDFNSAGLHCYVCFMTGIDSLAPGAAMCEPDEPIDRDQPISG